MLKQANINREDILEAYHFRHATKVYDDTRQISNEDFDFILEAGRLSPSSLGSEPWQFLVLQNPERRKKLMPLAPGAAEKLRTASHFVILLARKDLRYDSEHMMNQMTKIQKMPQNTVERAVGSFKSFQEQNRILDNDRTLFDWASKQTYIALGNMLTAAALAGIDSTPMEGFDREAVEDVLHQEGVLNKDAFGVSVMAAFGYRKEDPPREKARQSPEEVVRWA